MIDRDFTVNVVVRSRGVAGLVQRALLQAESQLGSVHKQFRRPFGDAIWLTYVVLVDPSLASHPDLMLWLDRERDGPTWETLDVESTVEHEGIRHAPIDATLFELRTAAQVLAIFETCRWQLEFLINDGNQAEVPEMPKIRAAAQAVVDLLFANFVRPLWQRFPDLERRELENLLPWPSPG